MLCKEGLKLPQTVKAAIEEYHKDSDKIRCFMDECLEADTDAEVRTAAVYKEYQQWCEDNGYRAESSKKFKESLGGLAEVVRKRPKGGGSQTTILLKYKLTNAANPL